MPGNGGAHLCKKIHGHGRTGPPPAPGEKKQKRCPKIGPPKGGGGGPPGEKSSFL